MKALARHLVLAALALVASQAACGGDGAKKTRADCVGAYAGTFQSTSVLPVSGTLTGTLAADGTFSAVFMATGLQAMFSGSGTVNEDGTVNINAQGTTVTGTINFDSCDGSGMWMYSAFAGTWAIHKS